MTAIFEAAMSGIQAVAERSAMRMVDCLFAGTLIAVFAGLMSLFSRRQSSSLRFAVWFSALVAIAASLFLSGPVWIRNTNASAGLSRAAITLPGSWAVYVFGLWGAVTAWFLLRIGVGLWRLHALRRTFVRVDVEKLNIQVQESLKRAGGKREVSLCTSACVRVPAVIGLIEPVVVVPRWALDELSANELNQVLLHEIAHLRRRDGWTNLAQQVIKAVLFFHPAVWWIESKISLEREMACDDAVLAETANPHAYAECLRHIAEMTLIRRSLALAQAVLGRVRQTSMRVAQILHGTYPRSAKHGWRTALSLASLVIVCGLIELKEPRLIAFQDGNLTTSTLASEPYRAPAITPVSFKTAEFKTEGAIPSKSFLHPAPVRALMERRNPANETASRRSASFVASSVKAPALFRLTAVRHQNPEMQMIASEAVFVVVENRGYGINGEPVYEIEVLHLTVLHPSIPSIGSEIPHKEI
jgi:beta-lactamase regulating signal transducer with metallopeptidase domain